MAQLSGPYFLNFSKDRIIHLQKTQLFENKLPLFNKIDGSLCHDKVQCVLILFWILKRSEVQGILHPGGEQ